MDAVLYWFSGTGNSLAVARDLAKELGGARLVPIAHALASPAPPAQVLGVVFPVYYFGPPLIVDEFLRTVPVRDDAYVFTVATNGGLVGATHATARRILAGRGIALAAGWSVHLPGNYIAMYPPVPQAWQRQMFARAKSKVRAIAGAVRRGERGAMEDSRPPFAWLACVVYRRASARFHRADRRFHATDACTRCGLCEKLCPVENIRLVDGRPEWQHRCEQCMACIQWCPVEAIQVGKRTRGRRRYHHPEVAPRDLCLRDPV